MYLQIRKKRKKKQVCKFLKVYNNILKISFKGNGIVTDAIKAEIYYLILKNLYDQR